MCKNVYKVVFCDIPILNYHLYWKYLRLCKFSVSYTMFIYILVLRTVPDNCIVIAYTLEVIKMYVDILGVYYYIHNR